MEEIPIIINSRDRLTPLRMLVDWLHAAGHSRIVILDNASTYPPLLEYYAEQENSLEIRRQGKNLGPYSLWHPNNSDLLQHVPFVYSDSDVVPDSTCPPDLISFLWDAYQQHAETFVSTWAGGAGLQKIGPSLRIDDIPDCYAPKPDAVAWEHKHFGPDKIREHFRGVALHDAAIDTTFALYGRACYTTSKPFSLAAARTGTPYIARHLAWYADSENLTEEEQYYERHASKLWSNWGAKECSQATVKAWKRSRERKKSMIHFSKLPMAIDMACYAPFYTDAVKKIPESRETTIVVEAGTRYGCSARILAEALETRDDWHLHLIDPVATTEALEIPQAYPDNVSFHQAPAEHIVHNFHDGCIDLLHIDADVKGDHPYEMGLNILLGFWNKLKPGGSIVLHDCSPHFQTITRLANELEGSKQWTLTHAEPHSDCPISCPAVLTRLAEKPQKIDGITVVIPIIKFNYLRSALTQIQNNTVQPKEIILIDNSGHEVGKPICKSFPGLPIRYLPQTKNLGVNGSWSLGLRECQTEIVSVLNDDLRITTTFFESLAEIFERMPLAGFVVPCTVPNERAIGNRPGLPLVVMLPTREGWAMTLRKSLISEIPPEIFTFYGDDFWFDQVRDAGYWALKMHSERIYHKINISLDVPERAKLGLPSLAEDRSAWENIQARGRKKSA